MPYLALYRQWRPQRFEEIVGQEHVTRTLQNALLAGRLTHAYLFSGPRGTGKTTTAKVLAKALNCSQRRGAEPCNECTGCREITAGTSMDVVEIDAASHRGIDEIRELREKVRLVPASARYRVYIIDEVHMLTNEAFNALLKTMEEPPAHVIFILATTEPHKVPLTILSRCQRFDFHRIGLSDILARLREVAAGAGLQVDEQALYLIARAADGGLRDALGILDQAAAFANMKVTAPAVHQVLGTVQHEVLDGIADALAAGRTDHLLRLLANLVNEGKDLRLFTREMTSYLRRLLLLQISPEDGVDLAPEEKERFWARAAVFTREQLLHILHILTRVEQDMKWSSQPRVLLEVALVESVFPGSDDSMAALLRRVADLESRLERLARVIDPGLDCRQDNAGGKGTAVEQDRAAGAPERDGTAIKPDREKVDEQPELESGLAGSRRQRLNTRQRNPAENNSAGINKDDDMLSRIKNRWSEVLDVVKGTSTPVHMYLARSWPLQVEEGCLTVAFSRDDVFKELLETPDNRRFLEEALAVLFKGSWQVRCVYSDAPLPRTEDSCTRTTEKLDATYTIGLFGAEEVDGEP